MVTATTVKSAVILCMICLLREKMYECINFKNPNNISTGQFATSNITLILL